MNSSVLTLLRDISRNTLLSLVIYRFKSGSDTRYPQVLLFLDYKVLITCEVYHNTLLNTSINLEFNDFFYKKSLAHIKYARLMIKLLLQQDIHLLCVDTYQRVQKQLFQLP